MELEESRGSLRDDELGARVVKDGCIWRCALLYPLRFPGCHQADQHTGTVACDRPNVLSKDSTSSSFVQQLRSSE